MHVHTDMHVIVCIKFHEILYKNNILVYNFLQTQTSSIHRFKWSVYDLHDTVEQFLNQNTTWFGQ